MDCFRVDGLPGDEFNDEPLGAPGDRPAEVERRGSRVAAGQNEGGQRPQSLIEGVDLALEALDLVGRDPQPLALANLLRRGEVGAEIEEVVLDARQHGVELGAEVAVG